MIFKCLLCSLSAEIFHLFRLYDDGGPKPSSKASPLSMQQLWLLSNGEPINPILSLREEEKVSDHYASTGKAEVIGKSTSLNVEGETGKGKQEENCLTLYFITFNPYPKYFSQVTFLLNWR